jgi:hypothetical protein
MDACGRLPQAGVAGLGRTQTQSKRLMIAVALLANVSSTKSTVIIGSGHVIVGGVAKQP